MSTPPLKILAIDDDPGDAELLRRALKQIESFSIGFQHAPDQKTAADALADQEIGVIFLDYHLGTESGLEVLKRLRKAGEARPIIALTGHGDEYIARDLMESGADGYLAKREISPDALLCSIESVTSKYRQRQLEAENRRLTETLKEKNEVLEQRNRRLAELYDTAHEFVDNVSHEFRTPLTVIKEFTSILNDGLVGEVSEEQKEYLGTVLDRVDDLATMIDDMLDISKLESGLLGVARKACSTHDILERVRKTLERKAASNQIALVVSTQQSLPTLYCDPEKISRVIINLTINAIKFSDEGSQVELWTSDESDSGMIRFGVTDHGPGIDPEKVSEIFDRFQQIGGDIRSSTKGFGLGLNIARELVHLNFGDIDVKSKVGEGSTFSFTVPAENPSKLINRYLNCKDVFRNGSSYVSTIRMEIEQDATQSAQSDVECFIQHQIRKTDLILPVSTGGWIIVAASNGRDIGNIVQRIERSYTDANRNRPGLPLPDISMNVRGTWSIAGEREDFVTAFMNEINSEEAIYA